MNVDSRNFSTRNFFLFEFHSNTLFGPGSRYQALDLRLLMTNQRCCYVCLPDPLANTVDVIGGQGPTVVVFITAGLELYRQSVLGVRHKHLKQTIYRNTSDGNYENKCSYYQLRDTI